MKKIEIFLVVSMAGCLISCQPKETAEVSAVELSCEYLSAPLGIDVEQPRLGWKIRAAANAHNGQLQTACRVLVASSPEQLAADQGDLWDSGKMKSSQSVQVVYKGKPLETAQRCYWKVRIWNNHGQVSGWSQPACWGTGILPSSAWQGEWIGDQPDTELRKYKKYVEENCKEQGF